MPPPLPTLQGWYLMGRPVGMVAFALWGRNKYSLPLSLLRTGPELCPPLLMSLTWTTSSMWVPLLTSRVVGVSRDLSTCWLVLCG